MADVYRNTVGGGTGAFYSFCCGVLDLNYGRSYDHTVVRGDQRYPFQIAYSHVLFSFGLGPVLTFPKVSIRPPISHRRSDFEPSTSQFTMRPMLGWQAYS
jgi:hypothetical protein